jgi:hypothetical protein
LKLAARTIGGPGVTVLGLTHPCNTATKPMNTATCSRAFIAAARSAYFITGATEGRGETTAPWCCQSTTMWGPQGRSRVANQRLNGRGQGAETIGPTLPGDHQPVTATADEALATSSEPGGRAALYPRQRTCLSMKSSAADRLEASVVKKTRPGRQALHLQL